MLDRIKKSIKLYRGIAKLYMYDCKRYFKNSMVLDPYKTQGRLLGLITARQHVVEKGLTMPNPRLGFGKENIIALVSLCNEYENRYDVAHEQFVAAISVLKEYIDFHKKRQFKLDKDLLEIILSLIEKYSLVEVHPQIKTTSDAFFSNTSKSFDIFARSRHTVRNYSEEDISEEELRKVIELAQTAPSACNRQPIRVHICDKNIGQEVLKYHNGNRGFGNLANKVLVITADLSSYMNNNERNCAFIDGGIFVMNLLYALHFYHIGACTLNWSATIEQDKNVHNLLSIPEREEIICMLTIGKLPKELAIANSERINIDRIITLHNK